MGIQQLMLAQGIGGSPSPFDFYYDFNDFVRPEDVLVLSGNTTPTDSMTWGTGYVLNAPGTYAISRADQVANFADGAVEVSFTAPATGFVGVTYRTTQFDTSGNYTFGWIAYYAASTDNIGVGYGSNAPGAGSFTNVSNGASGVTAGNPITLRVEFTGNTHNIYVNGVFKFAVTNSTYQSTAGKAGIYQESLATLTYTGLSVEGATDYTVNFATIGQENITRHGMRLEGVTSPLAGVQAVLTSGSHGRGYFDDLPSSLSGAFEITSIAHLRNNGTDFLMWLIYSNNDAGGSAYVDGYWADISVQLNAFRFIEFASGGGSGLTSGSTTGAIAATGTVKITRDGSGNFTGLINGTSRWTINDTSWTSGKFGVACGFTGGFYADYGIDNAGI